MTDLTREQIEELMGDPHPPSDDVRAACRMALRTHDAEQRIQEMKRDAEHCNLQYSRMADAVGIPSYSAVENIIAAAKALRQRAERVEARADELDRMVRAVRDRAYDDGDDVGENWYRRADELCPREALATPTEDGSKDIADMSAHELTVAMTARAEQQPEDALAQQAIAGGRNPHYAGTFDDETEEQAKRRREQPEDALAAQDTNLRAVATALRTTRFGLAPQYREQLAGIIDDVRRHLTASAVPYVPDSPAVAWMFEWNNGGKDVRLRPDPKDFDDWAASITPLYAAPTKGGAE